MVCKAMTPTPSPIPAATVILARPAPGALEVFLLRRHKASGFMSNAFVFPGGKVDATDAGVEAAAVRELFEEAGVLLCEPALPAERRVAWRRRLLGGEATFAELLAEERLVVAAERLHFWARWITPSMEPKRFDARFFLAELPAGQIPSFDDKETVEELWITPAAALERQAAGDLRLPPPQIRTLTELAALPDLPSAVAAAARRRQATGAITPRFLQVDGKITLLLPWDREYLSGAGEGAPLAAEHPFAGGMSRFVLDGMVWRLATAGS